MEHAEIVSQLVDLLARERRRVVATWRLWIYSARLNTEYRLVPEGDRRREYWRKAVERNRYFAPIQGLDDVYVLVAPFSNYLVPTEEQILQEVNPWAVISFESALIHHSLSNHVPSSITATLYRPVDYTVPPLGIFPEEWSEAEGVASRTPDWIERTRVKWMRTSSKYRWGTEISESNGVPVYVTDLERTLLDALRFPSKSGGVLNTLEAWSSSRARIDLDKITNYTEQFGIKLLKQRVGFILEQMSLSHPKIQSWKRHTTRGGSAKLVAGNSFASMYDESWNLSINVPSDTLSVLHE